MVKICIGVVVQICELWDQFAKFNTSGWGLFKSPTLNVSNCLSKNISFSLSLQNILEIILYNVTTIIFLYLSIESVNQE